MGFVVTATKSFMAELKVITRTRSSITEHIRKMDAYLTQFGVDFKIRYVFDVEPLGDGYFRFKFVPYRVIIKVDDNNIYFKKIFKRKGSGDYKNL